jgi:acetyl esterase/lipase
MTFSFVALRVLRLLLPVLFAALSILTVLKAPTGFFWKVQVALTEFPWIPLLATVVLFITCFWLDKYKTAALFLSGIALLLYCAPVARAYVRGSELKEELNTALPAEGKDHSGSAFSVFRMFESQKEIAFRTLTYKTATGKELTLDFYSATSSSVAPCIIVIHGGSWSSGDNKQFMNWNSWMAECGYHVAAINYGLAPEFKSPAQVNDVRDAIRFLKTQNDLNLDTTRFVLLGRSAGGQIALSAAYQLDMPEIAGVISIYAPADMVWGAKIKGNPLVLNTDEVFGDYLGGTYDEVPEKYLEASAVQHVNSASPATLIVHGDNDCMVSFIHSQHLDSALGANNVPHYFLDLPGATHACDYNLYGPSGQLMQVAIEHFLLTRK